MLLVDIAVVENEIISAIEETDTEDHMGDQSPIWEKIYEALENIRKQAFDGACT